MDNLQREAFLYAKKNEYVINEMNKQLEKKLVKHLLFLLIIVFLVSCTGGRSPGTASRASAGIAPDPLNTKEAVIQVYGADTWGWRGYFAIHTWIAVKRTNDDSYTVIDVVGWRGRSGRPVMKITKGVPDRYWYGSKPQLLKEHRGDGVDELIDLVEKAANDYPWKTTYEVFPGPNSNTFIAWIGKQVPQLELDLPFSAIGSGYVD